MMTLKDAARRWQPGRESIVPEDAGDAMLFTCQIHDARNAQTIADAYLGALAALQSAAGLLGECGGSPCAQQVREAIFAAIQRADSRVP